MKISKETIRTVLPVLVFVILLATNPNEQQLKAHIKNSLKQEVKTEEDLSTAINEAFSQPESWLMSFKAERDNFFLFSFYEVEGPAQKHEYLGILGLFIEFPS